MYLVSRYQILRILADIIQHSSNGGGLENIVWSTVLYCNPNLIKSPKNIWKKENSMVSLVVLHREEGAVKPPSPFSAPVTGGRKQNWI
jgi:hypothetical protein